MFDTYGTTAGPKATYKWNYSQTQSNWTPLPLVSISKSVTSFGGLADILFGIHD